MKRLIVFVVCSVVSSVAFSADASYQALSMRLSALETESSMLKNGIATQEQAREAMEKEVSALLKSAKETVKGASEQASSKQKKYDQALEKLCADLKQLKTHQNELSQTINEMAQTVSGMKESFASQSSVIKELEQAMRSLTIALQGKTKPHAEGNVHVVQSGDSLEKIARKYGLSLGELKTMNDLTSNTIRPGQELYISRK